MKENEYDGFTLAELLIVVAIIAVLTAVAIPVFTNQLEKSREAVDAANIRSLYAEVMSEAITTGADVNTDGTAKVSLKQAQEDWQNESIRENLYSIANTVYGDPSPDGTAWVSYEMNDNSVAIHFDGASGGGGSTDSGDHTSGTAVNTTTANAIGDSLIKIMNKANSGNSTKITITVNPGGSYSIEIDGKKSNLTEEEIRTGLEEAGLISDGVICFETSDPYYENGYSIKVSKNNGNGGKITITKL